MAVEKPSGLLSQPGLGVDQQDSLIGCMQVVDSELRLVHRLDRDTSGLLLLARGAESLRRCSMLFSTRRVRKLYVAVRLLMPDLATVPLTAMRVPPFFFKTEAAPLKPTLAVLQVM